MLRGSRYGYQPGIIPRFEYEQTVDENKRSAVFLKEEKKGSCHFEMYDEVSVHYPFQIFKLAIQK